MTLRLYDTASRSVRDFVPQTPGRVGVYLCGLTVQGPPHVGHLRSGVNYDVLRRWLEHSGYDVTFIRNLTDIDDRILNRATAAGQPFWAIAYANERVLTAAYDALGVLPPTYEPRATGHVPEMLELIATLVENGHAYPADDGSGDVYFDVKSYADYGALSGQRPEAMLTAEPEGGPERAKRDPHDFALWKGQKPDEPADASWPSPWGRGRPGWHIECSAMCRRYLGAEFDIHGGGLDLVFPHHENEVAQSRSAGLPFARYWVHHGLVNLGETKMSKSLGNVLGVDAVAAIGIRPVELRYYLSAPHYRSAIEYSVESMHEAAAAYRRIEGFVRRATERFGAVDAGPLCADFVEAMDDDLNTPRALASVHEVVRDGNTALANDAVALPDGATALGDGAAASANDVTARGALASVRAMLGILGLDPLAPQWSEPGGGGASDAVVHGLVALALDQRAQARERRDWGGADAIRDQLREAGVMVEDTQHGPRWTLTDGR